MNKNETIPLKLVMLEMLVYAVVIVVSLYLDWYYLGTWLLSHLFEQNIFLRLFDVLPQMDGQIALVLGFLLLAIILFATEKISIDLITLLLLIGLVVFQVLTPEEAFAGFSNEIIIILVSIFVLSGALQQTGVMDALGRYLLKISGRHLSRLLTVLMVATGALSMFINNTTATAVFIPPALTIAKQVGVSPSKLLIPLAYASILGGTATLIGTSTNVAISGYIVQLGMTPISLFELLPVGLIILGVGILYIVGIGHYLLPAHPNDDLTEDYEMREYLSEVIVMPESNLIGQKIFESDLAELDFRILAVVRGSRKFRPNIRSKFAENDLLLVQGQLNDLLKVKETAGIGINPELKWEDHQWRSQPDQTDEVPDKEADQNGIGENGETKVAEALIIPKSDLIGRTLKSANFYQRYGLTVLAIYRQGHSLHEKIGRIRFRLGDMLLLQGPQDRLNFLRRSSDFWILEEISPPLYRKQKGLLTIAALVVAVVMGGLGWLPLSIAFLSAAVVIVISGCLSIEEAYESVDWRLIILIGGMTAFGVAMDKTGTAQLLATWVVNGLAGFGVMPILAGFFLLTIGLTQPMSNAAAALVVLPVALRVAQSLQVNERTFAIAIMLAASISLITPFEPSCILVYGPGKYKFIDFVKTGFGLTLILMVIVLLLIPIFWPL